MAYKEYTDEREAKKAVSAYKFSLLNQMTYDELVDLAIENDVKFKKNEPNTSLVDKIAQKKFRGFA